MKTKILTCALTLAALAAGAASNADRVRQDFPKTQAKWVHYAVPAMSNVQRLPDAYPTDGTPGGTNRIVMAKNEFEPCSILFYAFDELGKVQLELGDLKQVEKIGGGGEKKGEKVGGGGERFTGVIFPKENLDLKLVKCWYQNLNAWFSYFGDTGNKLVPELLVHDEDLIRVDTKEEANYARLVGKDGKTVEKWLNAPPKTEGRLTTCDGRETFKPVASGFADAKTLKPVRFAKGEFRNFFLTARTTKDTPAGIYRGEIKVKMAGEGEQSNNQTILGSIPVEIRVLDFELPQPKAYRHPEMDFLVADYAGVNYLGILKKCGGDRARALELTRTLLKNRLEHNETMNKLEGDCDEGVETTVRLMKEVGMRTDILIGGVGSGGYFRGPSDANYCRRQAKARRAWCDRVFGHHNVYLAFGDEPPAVGVMAARESAHRGFGEQGFKFFIAGWSQIFDKGTMIYDWANVGTQPTIPSAAISATKWDDIGDKHVAWYAGHHVASENPAFNRRQNGLGAWLNGFTALCNYENGYGPYNDRTTMYRAMAMMYLTADGCLDTLQWEGFREGVDDVRYATLLAALSREAKAKGDYETKRLGYVGLTFLAQLVPDKCDLAANRADMQRLICEIKASLARPQLPPPEFVEPKDEKEKKRYVVPFEFGKRLDELCPEPKVAKAKRRAGFEKAIYYVKDVRDESDTNRMYRACLTQIDGWPYLPRANDEDAIWLWNIAEKLQCNVSTDRLSYGDRVLDTLVGALVRDGQYARAEIVATRAFLYDPKIPAKTRFRYMAACRLGAAKPNGLRAAYDRLVKEYGKDIKPEDRERAVCEAGVVANAFCETEKVRAIEKLRASLMKDQKNKTYVVKYSSRPILGPNDWDALEVKPEKQPFDRAFGGSTEYLYTDVSSGARAVADPKAKERLPAPTLEVVTDDWGLHFRFTAPDPKAREVELGLAGGGSYELYLSAGANRPYVCITCEDTNEKNESFWNTTYTTEGHHRIESHDRQYYRMQTHYRDDAIVMTLDFAWSAYAESVPENGAIWNFENMRWCRTGNYAWNGLNSIHGRSTWGDLRFDMPAAARARILRRQLFRARGIYEASKDVCGTVGKWNDKVLGDVAFYDAVVKPLVARYDAIAAKLDAKTPDAEILRLSAEVMPKWLCLEETIGRLRADWLNARIAEK